MVLFPNCKINLGLNVTSKREDGYHNIETVFYPVALTDALEIIQTESSNNKHTPPPGLTKNSSTVTFKSSGLPIAGSIDDNLCIKAYHLLKKDFPEMPSVAIHLHKVIPMGAGLGGGSSDGSFALKIINQICELNLSEDLLKGYALQLGSDCPFFISNKPCFATGRGEIMQEIQFRLSGYEIVIVHPGIHVSTAEAFAQILPKTPHLSILKIIEQPVQNWKDKLMNDFERGICQLHPEIGRIKEELYAMGAVYSSMSGSGSSVFGLFEKGKMPNFTFSLPYPFFHIKQQSLI